MIGERMDALADELATTVERMREDALRTRLVESLGQALDLDEVLARCAEAAAALHGVAGATVAVEVDGVPLSAAAGLAIGAADSRGQERSAALRTAAACGPSGSRTTTPSRRRRDGDPVGDRGPARERPRAARLPDRLRVQRGAAGHRQRLPDARGDRPPHGGRDRGGAQRREARAGAGRRRPADRARQPPGAPRDARARGRPGAPPRPPAGGLQLRHRRLQADERPDRAARGRRDPRRGRGGAARDAPSRRPRLPQRRRRVRRDPAGRRPDRGRGALRARPGHAATPADAPASPSASRPASPS